MKYEIRNHNAQRVLHHGKDILYAIVKCIGVDEDDIEVTQIDTCE